MGHSKEQDHLHPTNKEVLEWFKDVLENGKVSEEIFKTESVKFFNICQEMEREKKLYKREVEAFAAEHKNMLKRMEREFLKERGGSGKNHVDAPNDFREDIEDERERKKAFLQFARDGVKSSKNYQEWLDDKCSLFSAEKKKRTSENDKTNLTEDLDNQIKLVRERSGGKNIYDTEKVITSKSPDRTIKKTYAKITVRKRHQDNSENSKEVELSGAGVLKRAKGVDNILNHTSEHNKEVKASLMAKIIDKTPAAAAVSPQVRFGAD